MALIDELEFCHYDLNQNLNQLVRAAEGTRNVAVLGCGDVLPERKAEAECYAKALEVWLGSSSAEPDIANQFQTVCSLLGKRGSRKDQLAGHLITRRAEFHGLCPWVNVSS